MKNTTGRSLRTAITAVCVALLIGCVSCGESTIDSEYRTVKTKKLILENEDGKSYEIQVDTHGNLRATPLREQPE